MSTPANLEANCGNAQKSTGPRTDAGKARSAQNARTHGLTGRDLVLLPGEEDEFDEMQAGLYSEILPEGALEDELFKSLIHAAWNQRRCRRAESGLQKKAADQGLDPLLDPALDPDLRRIELYARRAAGAFHRNLKAIRDLQTERHSRLALKEVHPQAKTTGLGLTRLAAVRQTAVTDRLQATRLANAEVTLEIRNFDRARAALDAV